MPEQQKSLFGGDEFRGGRGESPVDSTVRMVRRERVAHEQLDLNHAAIIGSRATAAALENVVDQEPSVQSNQA